MRQSDGGSLKDFYSGQSVPARLVVNHEGTLPDDLGASAYPNAGTPAYNLFNGICDLGNPGIVAVRNRPGGPVSALILTFTNLDSSRKYTVAGTSIRGNNNLGRWTIATLQGVVSYQNAHEGNGVYTNGMVPGTIQPGQAAWNSGENRANGAVIGWSEIDPGPDGSFSIRFDQHIDNPLPNGFAPDLTGVGYAFNVVYLADVGPPVAPHFINPAEPTNRIVLQNRSTALSAVAMGLPLPAYQWYRDGIAIDVASNPAARSSTYVIPRMSSADAGDYSCVASNSAGEITSRIARVGYAADNVGPRVVRAVGNASFDAITVEFDEEMDIKAAVSPFAYTFTPALDVTDVSAAPGARSFILRTAPQTADTLYTLTVAGEVYDYSGNAISAPYNTLPFRSWVTSGCSGVLFEGFHLPASVSNIISALTNSANYPHDPFTNVFINRMHSRAIFPDNDRDHYGARMRALFIPLVSGDWRFYLSTDGAGELWFNPAGAGPSGRTLIARETNCCNVYQPPGKPQTSPAFPLIAGQPCYLELLYKETVGADFGMVAARLEDTGVPSGGNDLSGENSESIGSATGPSPFCTIGFGAVPAGAAGALSITQDPSGITTQANRQVTFTVGADAPDAPYLCYQWQRSDDGGATFNNIPGANRPSYTTPYLTVADDDQDRYRVIVSIPGADQTSASATVTVTRSAPAIRIARVARDITLSWTDPEGAFQLQQSSSLTSPAWSKLNGATGVGGNYSITITVPASGERFYRLLDAP